MLFSRANWPVRKWLVSSIHLRASEETKSRLKSKFSTFFGRLPIYRKTIGWKEANLLVSVCYIRKPLFTTALKKESFNFEHSGWDKKTQVNKIGHECSTRFFNILFASKFGYKECYPYVSNMNAYQNNSYVIVLKPPYYRSGHIAFKAVWGTEPGKH